mgnify:CR=1 FL=1
MASCSEQFLKVSWNDGQTDERTDIRITIYPRNLVCGGYDKQYSEDFRIEQKSFDASVSIRVKGHSSPELDMYKLIVENSTPAVWIMASGFQSTRYPTDSYPSQPYPGSPLVTKMEKSTPNQSLDY